jgi:hypothetical protein
VATFQPDVLGSQLFQARIKAHDVLQEHLKQIITIASATLALTVAFLKDVIGSEGERAIVVWTLPLSWVCLGASIALSIITISILVNSLDWAAIPEEETEGPDKTPVMVDRSYAAGARFHIHWWVVFSFGSFALGMVLLGSFAAANYYLFVHPAKTEYKISSASEAVDQARTKLPKDALQVQVSKVELIKGVNDLASSTPVWHVQLQYEVSLPNNVPIRQAAQLVRSTKRSRVSRRDVSGQLPPKSKIVASDFFLDAKTGSIIQVP